MLTSEYDCGFLLQFVNISKAKAEMGLNTQELEALRKRTITERVKPLSIEDMSTGELKTKADELWKQIIQLETAMYDLHERSQRQDYDVSRDVLRSAGWWTIDCPPLQF